MAEDYTPLREKTGFTRGKRVKIPAPSRIEVLPMKKLFTLTLAIGLFCFSQLPVLAQDQPTQPPTKEEIEKEKAERSKNAYRLLDQVIDEAQSLRLIENRVRVQIIAGDMLWDQNQGRARSLFSMAADGVAEMGRAQAAATTNRRGGEDGFGFATPGNPGPPRNFRGFQLRQELVLAVARHDATLAYQLLAATKPPAGLQPEQRGPRPQLNPEENLEQALLARVAALDPKLAAQTAEQMMEKGQFPRTLPDVINQLYRHDPEAAAKLADKTVKKIQATNVLVNQEANTLAQLLIGFGPRPPASGSTAAKATPPASGRGPALEQAAYVELLSSMVDAALRVNPSAMTNQRGAANQRRAVPAPANRQNNQQPLTEAQIEQTNARILLGNLQLRMPEVEQYLPAKASLVRQKLSEVGISNESRVIVPGLRENPTADALIQAAATAPPQMQPRLYQQAALQALEEGDTERARQIATNHLQDRARDVVMQRVNLQEVVKKTEGARFDEIRQAVARLRTDREKVELLIQAAGDAQESDQKLALQLLDEARQITNRRASSYEHFDQQLRVANAYATLDPARSFEVLEPGIAQLNELLAAAAVLSGFEVSMFRDGEMTLGDGNGLTSYVNRFGQELAVLARKDFERSETLAGRFQFLEPRIMTRLSIVQGLLDVRPSAPSRVTVTSRPFRQD